MEVRQGQSRERNQSCPSLPCRHTWLQRKMREVDGLPPGTCWGITFRNEGNIEELGHTPGRRGQRVWSQTGAVLDTGA